MKIARIQLDDKHVDHYEFEPDVKTAFMGGRLLGLSLIAKNASPWEPLDPRSPLVISVGCLGGTGFPLGNRITFVFRSPLTRTIAWAHSGGYAAYEMASLGIGAFYITGRCEKLSTIVVTDKGISIVDAEAFRGVGALETTAVMRMATGDARILAIGPAGEKKLPVATVINDMGRTSGVRHGVGAIFGSKNIKAIVIKSSKRNPPRPRNSLAFAQTLRKMKKKIESSHLLNIEKGLLAVYGTPIAVEALGENDAIPVKNFSDTFLAGYQRIGGKQMSSSVLVGRLTCSMCPVSCRRDTIAYGTRGEGPDYAQISSLGTNCYVLDHEKIAYLNTICYDAGIDPIEMGNTLAVYAEMSEKGYTEKKLEWGDVKHMAQLIEETARGENLATIIGNGAYYAAKAFGDTYYAPTVKNISIQNTDPRAEPAWGLVNAVENFGAGVHIWVYPTLIKSFEKIGIQTIYRDTQTSDEIASKVYQKQVEVAALDSLGVCAFSKLALETNDYVEGVSGFFGVQVDSEVFETTGRAVLALERKLNEFYGFGPGDDGLPKKFVETPLPSGKHSGKTCPIDELLKHYRKTASFDFPSHLLTTVPKLS
ncbi:MAG: aldehyde ferredoxin oxidoreductase C-terminal domain-containing protein [Candidatus Caldarchaeum sp.]